MLNLEKDTYTKEEVLELFKPFQEEFETLKTNVAEGNKAIERVKELESANLTNSIKLEAIKAGLNVDEVFDLINSESLEKAQEKINKLVDFKKQQKIDNSFKPEEKFKSTDEYLTHEKSGNVEGMLKSKFSKLFNN